jgi:hypothetical protein
VGWINEFTERSLLALRMTYRVREREAIVTKNTANGHPEGA